MYEKFEKWADKFLENGFPEEVVAANFNFYEDADNNWSIEIVGTASFDEDDEDWAGDEVTDLGSRDELFSEELEKEWDEVLEVFLDYVRKYLEQGRYADTLKELTAVGAGFVDGDLEILYKK